MPSLIDTLEQEEAWFGRDGFPYQVSEMDTSHLINTVAFLRRRAESIYERAQWTEVRLMSDAPDDVFEEWEAENRRAIPSDPMEWLNNRPLIQAMEREVKKRESIAPDMLQVERG